ncbi:MAG TPA: RNA-binding domain-containing protein [Pyrinomonadaceae bacterium]|nr:RNA-binding domain-containing protein [Pyrinomonadaceae bacterium]
MARRKFRNQRHEPATQRTYQEYVLSTPAPQTSRDELMRLVRGGEDTFLELKVKLSNPEKIAQGIVALANTTDGRRLKAGLIVFGVNDNLRVEGVDDAEEVRDELVRICREEVVPPVYPWIEIESFDNGRRIVALYVEGTARPYRTRDGRFFLRVGAERREAGRDELSALMDEARPVHYENMPAVGASLADVDEAHLWTFVREFEGDAYVPTARTLANYPTGDVLEKELLLAAPAGDGERVPTVAGLLLFGRDERVAELLPRASVVATRFAGDTPDAPRVESLELGGNLHTLYESALRFVGRYCELWEARPRTFPGRAGEGDERPAVARANYHRAAVGEALANALIHRDLALREPATRINVFDNSVQIVNPRRSAGFTRTDNFTPSAQRAILYGVPQRLNPQLAALFRSPAYGLKLATGGLPALLRHARLFSGRRAEVQTFNDEFRLRLHGT